MGADEDRCEIYRRHRRLDAAYRAGDMAGLKAVLGWPQDFPNTPQPMEYASGDWPLVTAIALSPLRFIRQLLDLGADPNYQALDGFPSLMTVLDAPRPDTVEVIALLLHYGADVAQRGINDWTPLHYAVVRRNLGALELFLQHGADPAARTRIDNLETALEIARSIGFTQAAERLESFEEKTK